jgi:hypothetical protein
MSFCRGSGGTTGKNYTLRHKRCKIDPAGRVSAAQAQESQLTKDPVVVFTSAGPGYADIIKSTLEAAGIPAVVSREGAGAAYGFTVGAMGLVDVLVAADRADEARALLAELQLGDTGDEAEDDDSAMES